MEISHWIMNIDGEYLPADSDVVAMDDTWFAQNSDWIDENCGPYELYAASGVISERERKNPSSRNITGYAIKFENDADATLFKLRWM